MGSIVIAVVLMAAGLGGSTSIAGAARVGTGPVAGAPGLPDGRAYEQVSPTAKNGYNVRLTDQNEPGGSVTVSTEGGEAVDYQALGAFEGAGSNVLKNIYIGTRSLGRWSTSTLDPLLLEPPHSMIPGAARVEYVSAAHLEQPVFDSDQPLTSHAPATFNNEFLRRPDGSYSLLTTTEAGVRSSEEVPVLGASVDLSHIIFGRPVYEWANGELRLAAVLPDGTTASNSHVREIGNPISNNGSRIFFMDSFPMGQLYDRIMSKETIRVSASQRKEPDPLGTKPVKFEVATSDGANVFFISCEKLTDESTAAGIQPNCYHNGQEINGEEYQPFEGTDLYLWHEDPATHARKLTDLTIDTKSDPAGASVQGILGMSSDGSYVYFVAQGRLAAGATAGQDNLYLWHEGGTRFIASLTAGDSNDWGEPHKNGEPSEGRMGARVTADGRHLAFMSTAEPTGYNNIDVVTGARDSEIYEYSADSEELGCASCDPTGARPIGNATVTSFAERSGYLARNLSADGSRLFFESPDPLVGGSASGHMKVFEYENGTVYMLSSGTSSSDDHFGDASVSGNDVFIVTQSQLGPQDTDTLYDLYDARVGGNAAMPPMPSAQCVGDSCQGAGGAPLAFGNPASESFAGTGNLASIFSGRARKVSPGKLSTALRVCRAKHNRRQRASCEASARRRYRAKVQAATWRGQR